MTSVRNAILLALSFACIGVVTGCGPTPPITPEAAKARDDAAKKSFEEAEGHRLSQEYFNQIQNNANK